MRIGLLLFPNLTLLDLTAPLEVFCQIPGASVSLIWKTLDPVTCDTGFAMLPTATFADCGDLDILCVPGGPGQIELMADAETLAFVAQKAAGCQWITSVCTGSLVLAAAGLLRGKRATSHWASLDQLALFGATPVSERVVRDGNLITGAGVTSGIDFALTVVALAMGEGVAQEIQLQIEYDPAPPFRGGSPKTAAPDLLNRVKQGLAPFIARRLVASKAARDRINHL